MGLSGSSRSELGVPALQPLKLFFWEALLDVSIILHVCSTFLLLFGSVSHLCHLAASLGSVQPRGLLSMILVFSVVRSSRGQLCVEREVKPLKKAFLSGISLAVWPAAPWCPG